jgi:hypothetical protein
MNDTLWKVYLDRGGAEFVVDPMLEETVRRPIDMTQMTAGASGYGIYFINKNDNTLWMYEL